MTRCSTLPAVLRRFQVVPLLVILVACPSKPSSTPAPAAEPGDPAPVASVGSPDPAYVEEIERWRGERDANLRRDDSWLTLVGLFWLKEGDNAVGTAPGSDLLFPEGKAPAKLGTLRLEKGAVRLRVEPGVVVTQDGKPVTALDLASDQSGSATVLEHGSLVFYVIQRGDRIGLRLKDRQSAALTGFKGIESFPLHPGYRIAARWERYDPPKKISIPNVLGQVSDDDCPGAIVFELGGATHRLEPTGDPTDELFLVFGDATNGKETYGGGRFLVVGPPGPDGAMVIDFNKAYNPPCVFSRYATCPLPPRQNRLPVRIEAGEKTYGDAPAHTAPAG